MSQKEAAKRPTSPIDQVVTWKEDGVWRTEEVVGVRGGDVLVEHEGETKRISEREATVTPISPFKNSPHPRDLASRSFMNAVREVVESYGIEDGCLNIIWCNDSPYCTFPPSVPNGTIQSIRRDVDDLTNSDVEPEEAELTCLRM